MSDILEPYAVEEIETTTTTWYYPTTTEPPLPEYQYTALTIALNSTIQSTHYIHFASFEVSGNGYLEIENTNIDANVTFDVHTESYARLKVTTKAPANGTSVIRLHCVKNGNENVIIFNINWGTNVTETAYVKIINNKRTFDYKTLETELCYVACGIDENDYEVYTSAGWCTITKDSTYPIFRMYIDRNDTEQDRTNTINLAFGGDDMSATYMAEDSINITQNKNNNITPSLIISNTDYQIAATATSITVNYTLINGTITEIKCNKGWLSAVTQNNAIRITTTQNTQNDRNAVISVLWKSTDNIEQTTRYINVTQYAPVNDGTFTIDDVNVSYQAQSGDVSYTLKNINADTVKVTTTSNWLSVSADTNSNKIIFETTENVGNTRGAIITVGYITNGGATGYTDFNIIQSQGIEFIEFPIWQDTDIVLSGESNYISYRFIHNDNIVYQGKAFLVDGVVTIRINDIVKNYLKESIDLTILDSIQDNNGYAIVKMQLENSEGNFDDYKIFRVYNDWSYKDHNDTILTKVIDNTLDKRQLFLYSVLDRFDDEATNVYVGGVQEGATRPYRRTFDIDSSISTLVQKCDYLKVLYVGIDPNEQEEYPITDTCKPYAIYYRQRNGGYSWLLCNNKGKQTDNIVNYEITRENNNTTLDYSKSQYLKTYEEGWLLKTDLLNNRQSEIIQELFHSNEIYLHILEEDKIIPVIITDTKAEYKTRLNNGRKLITYQINLTNSNTKQIK